MQGNHLNLSIISLVHILILMYYHTMYFVWEKLYRVTFIDHCYDKTKAQEYSYNMYIYKFQHFVPILEIF